MNEISLKYPGAPEDEITSLGFVEWNHLRQEDRNTYELIARQQLEEELLIQNQREKLLQATKQTAKVNA